MALYVVVSPVCAVFNQILSTGLLFTVTECVSHTFHTLENTLCLTGPVATKTSGVCEKCAIRTLFIRHTASSQVRNCPVCAVFNQILSTGLLFTVTECVSHTFHTLENTLCLTGPVATKTSGVCEKCAIRTLFIRHTASSQVRNCPVCAVFKGA